MAGPTAGIVLRDSMNGEIEAEIRADIQRMSTRVDGDDFWVQERHFILTLDAGYDGEAAEYAVDGVHGIIGWTPRGRIGFAAMCNEGIDHRLLGETCLHFARKMQGLVDFGGALLPPIQGQVQQLFHEQYFGKGNDWSEWEPHFNRMVKALPGKVYTAPYLADNGYEWVYHLCDDQFMVAWLGHPHFHMVK